jgi:di/tricarboxylate transporter
MDPIPRSKYAIPGILASILAAAIILMIPTPEGLPVEGQRMAALFAVALILFVTEAIPIAVTSVLLLMLQSSWASRTASAAFSSWVSPSYFCSGNVHHRASVTVTGQPAPGPVAAGACGY